MAFLEIRDLTKVYGDKVVLDGLNLSAQDGEFISLLGPSGSGKTTALRLIAGFLQPDGGSIAVNGKDITNLPVHRRNIGMVFQSYALFPHMTVGQNIASALDKKLRMQMQLELRQIQKEVGVTAVFVTHDHEEALTMSDRVAVMRDGRIVQLDTPSNVYRAPVDDFVAESLGEANFLHGVVR